MKRTSFFVGACLLAVLLSVSGVRADTEDPDALITEGLALRREGRDAAALERFTRAHALRSSPRAVAQIAFAEQALGRWVEAEEHLATALASEDAWIASRLAVLEEALTEIRSHLGTLEIHGAVSGVEIWVDGVRFAVPPDRRLRLPAGKHELVAPGFVPTARPIEIVAAETARLDLTSQEPTAPAPPATARQARRAAAKDSQASPTAGYVLLGVGATGVAVAAISGVVFLDRVATVEDNCVEKRCNDAGLEAGRSGKTWRAVGAVSIAVGIISSGIGGYLVLESDRSAAQVSWKGTF